MMQIELWSSSLKYIGYILVEERDAQPDSTMKYGSDLSKFST